MFPNHDLHTHTRHSDGSSTPFKLIQSAWKKGLETVAITDHGPELSIGIGFGQIQRVINDVSLARKDVKIDVLLGLEANTTGPKGGIDVYYSLQEKLDILLAGVHYLESSGLNRAKKAEIYLKTVINLMKRKDIDVLVHPFWYHEDLSKYLPRSDIETFAETAAKEDVAIELNEKYHVPNEEVLSICVDRGNKFSLGSDAHKPEEVGEFDWVLDIFEERDIGKNDLILECR